jgi:hypothetical protein
MFMRRVLPCPNRGQGPNGILGITLACAVEFFILRRPILPSIPFGLYLTHLASYKSPNCIRQDRKVPSQNGQDSAESVHSQAQV